MLTVDVSLLLTGGEVLSGTNTWDASEVMFVDIVVGVKAEGLLRFWLA